MEAIIYINVQITGVGLIRCAAKSSRNLLASFDGDGFGSVENGLFPVSILSMRTSGESNWLVASSECNIEPSNECVDIVITSSSQFEVAGECQIFLLYSEDINFLCSYVHVVSCCHLSLIYLIVASMYLERIWASNNSLDIDSVYKRLLDSKVLD